MGAEGCVEIDGLCDRCMRCAGDGDDQTLYNLAHVDDRTLQGLMHESQYSLGGLHEKAWEYARERMKKRRGAIEAKREELQDLKEGFSYRLLEGLAAGADVDELLEEYLGDETRRRLEEELAMMDQMEEAVEPDDIRDSLKEYVEKDLIEVKGDEVRITPKGAGALARYVLRRIWEHLAAARAGTHAAKEEGFGMSDGFAYRKHEYGDEFFRIDLERTLLAALEKGRMRGGRIEFDAEDLWVRETVFDTRLCVGLVVDESGSMSGDKIHAAVDISPRPFRACKKKRHGQDEAFSLFQPRAGDGLLGYAQCHVFRRHDRHTGRAQEVQDGDCGGARGKAGLPRHRYRAEQRGRKIHRLREGSSGGAAGGNPLSEERDNAQYHHARLDPPFAGIRLDSGEAEPGEGLFRGAQGPREGRRRGLSEDQKKTEPQDGGLRPHLSPRGLLFRKIRCSSPRRSRLMLSLCFTIMKTAMIAQARTKPVGTLNARRTTGMRAAAASEPSDTYPPAKSTARKKIRSTSTARGFIARKTPRAVATPLPPLNLR